MLEQESKVSLYGDFSVHPTYPHLIAAVLEDHTDPTPAGVLNKMCIINTEKKSVSILAEGCDFYNTPRFSPNGSTIAWTQWNHPDMPWEGGSVHVAPVVTSKSGAGDVEIKLGTITKVAGEAGKVASNYPCWSPAGATLHFLCDVSGYSNPWVWSLQGGARSALLAPLAEEFGGPAWQLDEAHAACIDEEKTLLSARRGGRAILYLLEDGVPEEVNATFAAVQSMRRLGNGRVVFIGSTATSSAAVILATLATDDIATSSASFAKFDTLYTAGGSTPALKPELLSTPESVTIDGPSGPVHTIYWPPYNPEYAGSDKDEKPSCVFSAHGGPTAERDAGLNSTIQYYTSRGWGWVQFLLLCSAIAN
jgi:dipeptidyl aminopeptidase/acylaminoacyl peptidase